MPVKFISQIICLRTKTITKCLFSFFFFIPTLSLCRKIFWTNWFLFLFAVFLLWLRSSEMNHAQVHALVLTGILLLLEWAELRSRLELFFTGMTWVKRRRRREEKREGRYCWVELSATELGMVVVRKKKERRRRENAIHVGSKEICFYPFKLAHQLPLIFLWTARFSRSLVWLLFLSHVF